MKHHSIISGGSIALLLVILALTGCVHPPVTPDNDPDPDPISVDSTLVISETCDPDTVYYVQEIQPILSTSCAFSGCHNERSAKGGIVLTTYGNLMVSGIAVAGNLAESELYESITESDPDKIMPPPTDDPLSTEQIATIEAWIRQGAQNISCEEEICDTTDFTYSGYIRPFLDNHCTGCHTGQNAGGGVFLSGFSTVQEVALDGSLLGSIQHDAGYKAMPKGEDKLADCDITKIRLWIEDGAPNN